MQWTAPTKPTYPMSLSEPVSLLVFGAHPDDIEFGCGGVIAAETRHGGTAHLVVCTKGEAGTNGTPEQREKEAAAAAALLGASLEFIELGGDAHLEHAPRHAISFAKIIRERRPALVLAPTCVENQHPDHAVVGKLARDAARLARYGGLAELKQLAPHAIGTLAYYALTADAEPRDISPVLIDISAPDVFRAWIASMEAHVSQMRTRNYVELQQARARLLGARCGVDYAQALFPNDPVLVESLDALKRSARRF
jgi:N-acetylglucosamine malate deacetylase 1